MFAVVGIRLSFEPASLDWNKGDVPIHVINNVMEGLYRVDEKGKVRPDQAQGYPTYKNGKWIIRIKKHLKWSDGKIITASDYIDSWKRLKSPETASTYTYLLKEFTEFEAKDSLTIIIKTESNKKPPTESLTHWVTFPIRSDLIEKHGNLWASDPIKMTFNGPYRISNFENGVKYVLTPNNKHREPGTLEKIEAYIVPDDSTALRLYDSGKLHFMSDLGSLDRKELSKRPDFHKITSPVFVYLGIDLKDERMKVTVVREMLNRCIDRTKIPTILSSNDIPVFELSIDMIKERISDKQSVSLSTSYNQRFDFKNIELGYYEKGMNRTLMEWIQNEFKTRCKIESKLVPSEIKSYWSKLRASPATLFLNSFSPPVIGHKNYFSLFESNNVMNYGHFKNQEYDKAITDDDLRKASEILNKEKPLIPLYFRSYEYLMKPSIKGAIVNPMTSLFLDTASMN